MGFQIPGGLVYEPADLNWNARVLVALASGNGAIVPWRAAGNIRAVQIAVQLVTSFNVDLTLEAVDSNGQTILEAIMAQNVSVSRTRIWWADNQPRSTLGAPSVTSAPIALGAPYLRLNMLNNDGVNPVTITVTHAVLSFQ